MLSRGVKGTQEYHRYWVVVLGGRREGPGKGSAVIVRDGFELHIAVLVMIPIKLEEAPDATMAPVVGFERLDDSEARKDFVVSAVLVKSLITRAKPVIKLLLLY